MNKATIHLSTGQYSFIEVEVTGSPDYIIRKWSELKEKYEARETELLKTTPKPF